MAGTWVDLKGEKGDTGDTGAPGTDGADGAAGADGHTPCHVSETEPTEDVRAGDTWFNPTTLKLQLCTAIT